MWERIMKVISLDRVTYRAIADDENATSQALIVIVLSLLIQGLFRNLVAVDAQGVASLSIPEGILGAIVGLPVGLLAWVLGSVILAWVASQLGGRTNFREMLRVTGYVSVFNVVSVLSILRLAGPGLTCVTSLVELLVGILYLIGYVIGVREAAEFSTGRAITAAILAVIVNLLIAFLLGGACIGLAAGLLAISH